jgi:3-oxoacyl-[acyl-carrier protein] reductase
MPESPVVLVTGASRGIGAATVARFARDGATVFAAARNVNALQQMAHELSVRGQGGVTVLPLDVADSDSIAAAFRTIFASARRLDVLVNCAGAMETALHGAIDAASLNRLFAVNSTGTILCQQAAARLMQRHQRGAIINVSSVMAAHAAAGRTAYAASKAAVEAATRVAAVELAPWGIRVNAVAPGWIETDLVSSLSAAQREATQQRVPMGRIGRPDEVASVIAFLASADAAYVTGAIVRVDGGYTP